MPRLISARECKELGLHVSRDGKLVDNRDGFYDRHPEDHIRTYDARTMVTVSKSLMGKLLEMITNDPA